MQDSFQTSQGPGMMFWLICGAVILFYVAAMWKVFEKAGKPGWASIIPIYNAIVILDIAGKPVWWILLYLIPIVNIVVSIMVTHSLSKNFGHDVVFTLGLIFLPFIFWPILAFGDSQYRGPAVGAPVPV